VIVVLQTNCVHNGVASQWKAADQQTQNLTIIMTWPLAQVHSVLTGGVVGKDQQGKCFT